MWRDCMGTGEMCMGMGITMYGHGYNFFTWGVQTSFQAPYLPIRWEFYATVRLGASVNQGLSNEPKIIAKKQNVEMCNISKTVLFYRSEDDFLRNVAHLYVLFLSHDLWLIGKPLFHICSNFHGCVKFSTDRKIQKRGKAVPPTSSLLIKGFVI